MMPRFQKEYRMDAINVGNDPRTKSDLKLLLELPREYQLEMMVRWLTGRDGPRIALATAIMVKTGKAAASMLVREALVPRRPTQHRVRLLQVVENIGQPLDAADWFDLQSAIRRYGAVVQKQIINVLAAHRRASVVTASPMANVPASCESGGVR
jgi:hypothetical protein